MVEHSLVEQIMMLFIFIFVAFCMGGSSAASRYLGKHQTEKALETVQHLLLVSVTGGRGFVLGLYLFREMLISFLFLPGPPAGKVMFPGYVPITEENREFEPYGVTTKVNVHFRNGVWALTTSVSYS